MPEVKLNWSTAEVKDAKLTVELDGKAPSRWKESFETTERLLGGGDWSKVQLKKRTVRVTGVSPGTEEKLRHHLESIVEQANTTIRPAEPEAKGAESGDDTPDAQMQERFRAFDDGDERCDP